MSASWITRDGEHGAGDVAGGDRAGQVDIGWRQLFGLGRAAKDRIGTKLGDFFGRGVGGVQRGPDGSGSDRVYTYTFGRQVGRQGVREGNNGALGAGVVQQVSGPAQGCDRTGIDDGIARVKVWQARLGHVDI